MTLCDLHSLFVSLQMTFVPSQWLCVTFTMIFYALTITLCVLTMTLCDLHHGFIWPSQWLSMTFTMTRVAAQWFYVTFTVSLWPFKWLVCLHNHFFLCSHNDAVCPQNPSRPSKWLCAFPSTVVLTMIFVCLHNMLWVFTVTLDDTHNDSLFPVET